MIRLLAAAVSLMAASAFAEAPRTFHVDETFTVPATAGTERTLYVPLPSDDPWQQVTALDVQGLPFEVVHDARYGDGAAKLTVPAAGATIRVAFDIRRLERSADLKQATGKPAPSGYQEWLKDDARAKVDARIRKIAAEQTKGLTAPAEKAAALYRYVLSTMKYDKTGQGWGNGDVTWACDMKYGNCTDFHALLTGLLRAEGIPARFQIGYSVPATKTGDLTGYHCWMDFYLDGAGWVPVDASEAWKHADKRDYFFGHHDADRFAMTTGRDIVLPGMKGTPLNYFVFPYLEVDGKPGLPVDRKVKFSGS